MRYVSTRSQSSPQTFTQAVAQGLAPDGGLYLPERLPDFSDKWRGWASLNYPELCREFLLPFVGEDFSKDELDAMTRRAYARFSVPEIAPLKSLDEKTYVLELFHGPTLAFKDFALQLLGEFYEAQIKRTHEAINVLGATSGDTGSAAIHGLLGKPGVSIFILYPDGRISPLQERQMACTGAANVFPIAIEGTFDNAQDIVKELFGERAFKEDCRLSAVNSINISRILAQCVYYFWAFLRLPESPRAAVDFVVPTGNFGNILAGWLARKMGLPIRSLRIATNQNDILHRLFTTGVYEVGKVKPSLAPSMDIQVASNFERFLYFVEGCDPTRVRAVMDAFKRTGRYVFENFSADGFCASRMDDAQIPQVIQRVYQQYGYVLDPHTACAFAETFAQDAATVVLATASPAKFPETIESAIGVHPTDPSLEALKSRPLVRVRLPANASGIASYIQRHRVR